MLKCNSCNKKINMMLKDLHICRCSNYYCSSHMHTHSCPFDYKQLFVKQNKDLVEIKHKKVEHI
jgi:hypothetical protein